MRPQQRAMRGRARFWILVALLGIALGMLVMGVRERAGMDRPLRLTGGGDCRVVEAPAGPEDLEIDTATGRVIISALDRRDPEAGGDLWMLPLSDPGAEPRRIPRDGPEDFRPHGLSLVRDAGRLLVFVVSHPADGHTVEVFELVDGRARHLATHAGDLLHSPNDVVAVDAERFYASNDHGTAPGIARTMEDLLGLHLADVVYRDSRGMRSVVDGLSYANGVALSADGSELIVAESMPGTVSFLDRDPATGQVEPRLLVDLDSGADNIDVAADGSIWVTGHPHLNDFLGHARDPSVRSATEVYRIVPQADGARVDLVLGDDGSRLSGGSVAVAWRDQLLVGAVFESKLLRCTLAPEHAVRPTRGGGLLERPAEESGEPDGTDADTQPADG
jgi:arylesterase/paraoxonase